MILKRNDFLSQNLSYPTIDDKDEKKGDTESEMDSDDDVEHDDHITVKSSNHIFTKLGRI